MSITAVYRTPFGIKPEVRSFMAGTTLAAMAEDMPGLSDEFGHHGVVCINGKAVPRPLWHLVRPKPGTDTAPVQITFHEPPRGGGDSGKSIVSLVASIALTAGAGFILSGGLATSSGLFAKGTLSAAALAAGVTVSGSLLLSGLVSPPVYSTPDLPSRNDDLPGNAGIGANLLEPNGPLSRVIGTHRITPRLASEALTYFDGEDELVEAVFALAGPHALSDIRAGDTPISSIADLELETREGWPGDAQLTIIDRHGRTENIQSEMRGHLISDINGTNLESQSGALTDALPLANTIATRTAPDELWMDIAFPSGLHRNASETVRIRVPFRIRIREIGALDWSELPELHYQAARLGSARATIRLKWEDTPNVTPNASVNEGWVEARHTSPGQNIDPAGADRVADASFIDVGDEYMSTSNLAGTGVKNVELSRYVAEFTLDTATFPRGRYEIEIKRGYAFRNSNYLEAAYTISGSVRDPFYFENSATPQISQSNEGIADTVYFLRAASVWNSPPVTTDDCALIAMRARNQRLDRVSVLASGYVKDWDGTGWNNWTTTSNPVPHFRDVMAGLLNMKPVPRALIDDAGLVDWRDACDLFGFECNTVVLGQSVADVLRVIASCGYARPYMSDVWGVVRDYDRSAESPVQVFTPRNMSNFSYTRGIADMPDGFRVTFADRENEYQNKQITVFRDGVTDDSGLVEQVTYQGLVTTNEAETKAQYDLLQAEKRATFYNFDAPWDALVCRKGSLVGVQHDMLSDVVGNGRVVSTTAGSAGFLTSITIDEAIETFGNTDILGLADVLAETDILKVGLRLGAVIRRSNGTITIHELSAVAQESQTLTFAAEIPDTGIGKGTLVSVGKLNTELERMLVTAITPRNDLTATLTLVDEASEIFA